MVGDVPKKWYNVNSIKENQAARSDIWFSDAFNEQAVCEADKEREARACEFEKKEG